MCLTTHKETGGEVERVADGGKSCCCLFSQIIYSKTGHNLLFILHILHQSDGSTFGDGVAAWKDREDGGGRGQRSAPLLTFVPVR